MSAHDQETRTILFVDDEQEILNALKRQFRKSAYRIVTASSGKAGLEILEKTFIPLVISDERMPEMSGADLLREVRQLYPDSIRIILSGYADSSAIIKAINIGEVYRFIIKPWRTDDMMKIIGEAFAYFDSQEEEREFMRKILEENRSLHREISRLKGEVS